MSSHQQLLQLIRDLKAYIGTEPKPIPVPKTEKDPTPPPPVKPIPSPTIKEKEQPLSPVKKSPSTASPSFFSLEPKQGPYSPPDMRWEGVFAKIAPSVVQIPTPPSDKQRTVSLLFLHSSHAEKEIDFLQSVSNALEGLGAHVHLVYIEKEEKKISHLLSEARGIIVTGHLLSSASQNDLPPLCHLEKPRFYIDNPTHKRALWNQLKTFVKQLHR